MILMAWIRKSSEICTNFRTAEGWSVYSTFRSIDPEVTWSQFSQSWPCLNYSIWPVGKGETLTEKSNQFSVAFGDSCFKNELPRREFIRLNVDNFKMSRIKLKWSSESGRLRVISAWYKISNYCITWLDFLFWPQFTLCKDLGKVQKNKFSVTFF